MGSTTSLWVKLQATRVRPVTNAQLGGFGSNNNTNWSNVK
jgi:hypothetical protein